MAKRIWLLLALAALPLFPPVAGADQAAEFKIATSDPFLSGHIRLNDTLYLRIAYKSEEPIRFQVQGFAAGKKVVLGAMYNPAPLHSAGEGEALAWISFRQPAAIDELRITAYGRRWQPVGTLSAPVTLEWDAFTPEHTRSEWADRLSHAQQQVTMHDMQKTNEGGEWIGFLLIAIGYLAIPGYFILQPWTIYRFTGGWRIAAALPLLAAVPLFGHAIFAFHAGSNIWPLGLIFFMPVIFLYLVAVIVLKRIAA
jgi:hypothetical protein